MRPPTTIPMSPARGSAAAAPPPREAARTRPRRRACSSSRTARIPSRCGNCLWWWRPQQWRLARAAATGARSWRRRWCRLRRWCSRCSHRRSRAGPAARASATDVHDACARCGLGGRTTCCARRRGGEPRTSARPSSRLTHAGDDTDDARARPRGRRAATVRGYVFAHSPAPTRLLKLMHGELDGGGDCDGSVRRGRRGGGQRGRRRRRWQAYDDDGVVGAAHDGDARAARAGACVRARVVERTAHARPRRRGPLGHSSSLALARALGVSRAALRCVGLAVLLGIGLIRGRAAERRRASGSTRLGSRAAAVARSRRSARHCDAASLQTFSRLLSRGVSRWLRLMVF